MKSIILKTIRNAAIAFVALFASSCNDYLNVVPDNIPTIDHAFANRFACEGFLFSVW